MSDVNPKATTDNDADHIDLSVGQELTQDKPAGIDTARERHEEDTQHRKVLVPWVMELVSVYLIVVGLIIAAVMFGIARAGRQVLSDAVLIALLTSTTATVLGLPWVVLKGLFSGAESTKNDQQSEPSGQD